MIVWNGARLVANVGEHRKHPALILFSVTSSDSAVDQFQHQIMPPFSNGTFSLWNSQAHVPSKSFFLNGVQGKFCIAFFGLYCRQIGIKDLFSHHCLPGRPSLVTSSWEGFWSQLPNRQRKWRTSRTMEIDRNHWVTLWTWIHPSARFGCKYDVQLYSTVLIADSDRFSSGYALLNRNSAKHILMRSDRYQLWALQPVDFTKLHDIAGLFGQIHADGKMIPGQVTVHKHLPLLPISPEGQKNPKHSRI